MKLTRLCHDLEWQRGEVSVVKLVIELDICLVIGRDPFVWHILTQSQIPVSPQVYFFQELHNDGSIFDES